MGYQLFDLKYQYNFYKLYHKDKINVAIHIFCIPMIVWSFSLLLTPIVIYNEFINLTFFISLLYGFYYLVLDLYLGKFMFLFMLLNWFTTYLFYYNTQSPIFWALAINIFSWVIQILGHKLFEGNQPAFMDSLIQSFLIAPMFVLIDVIKILNKSFTIGN